MSQPIYTHREPIYRRGSITDLAPDISVPTYVALQNAGIRTINAVKQCRYEDLLTIDGIDNAKAYEIATALENYDGTILQGLPRTVEDVIMLQWSAKYRQIGNKSHA